MAPLYTGEAKELTKTLIRISSLSLIPMVLNSVFNALLQYKHDFLGANMSTLAINLSIIIMMILVPNMSIKTLIGITVLANFIQILVQIPWIIKHKFKYNIGIKLDNNIKFILKVGVPLLIGTFASQLNNIIDKSIASTLPEGSISALSYAFKIISLPHVIFGYAIVTVSFPYIAQIYNKNKDELFGFVQDTSVYIAIIMVFATVYLLFMSQDVVTVLFGYGKFDNNAIRITSLALAGYCLGLPFLAIKDLYIRVFYTINSSKFVMKITIISVIINIVLNLSLVKYLGVFGLSLSTSISSVITTFISYYKVKKSIGINDRLTKRKEFLKIVLASIISVIPMSITYDFIGRNIVLNKFISLICISILALSIYVLLIYAFNINHIRKHIKGFINKLTNKNKIKA